MKKKIITFGIMLLFVLTIFSSVEAVELKNIESKDSETYTVHIHAFFDENENGIQDEGEKNAVNADVHISDFLISETLASGETDNNGNITLCFTHYENIVRDGGGWIEKPWKLNTRYMDSNFYGASFEMTENEVSRLMPLIHDPVFKTKNFDVFQKLTNIFQLLKLVI